VTITNVSLWDVENVETMPQVANMTVAPVNSAEVREFAQRYHYTGIGENAAWRWGLWHGLVLLGVVSYNLPTRSTCASVFGEKHLHRVWHMHRLILGDKVPRNSESRLIGGSLRAIRRGYPDVWAVLTYAATDVGHVGYVYQATNAPYTGTGGHIHQYVDRGGNRRSDYLGGHFVSKDRALSLGWTRRTGDVKHRYVYILGSAKQRKQRLRLLKLPNLPYPKAALAEVTS
jgi:hypothetical protein